MGSKIRVEVVSEFPAQPSEGTAYSLAGAKRSDVIHGTHVSHKYPAKFIPQIPRWALTKRVKDRRATVLDPFCGSGTTLVEAGRLGHRALGCDISPLAVLITKGKCALPSSTDRATWRDELWPAVLKSAKTIVSDLTDELQKSIGKEAHGLHYTWSNWFQPAGAAGIVAIRQSIDQVVCNEQLHACAMTALSSIIKSCSYLNEDQIKVRFDAEKRLANPFEAFPAAMDDFLKNQEILAEEYLRRSAEFDVRVATASALPFDADSVDAIVTSPPYINAVDYTMAHKYNLFLLGLLAPDDFKSHCRDYIGVTERAVRSSDLAARPACKVSAVTDWVNKLDEIDTPTSANRAYVVTQYFNGMFDSLREARRVLRSGRPYVMVVGESNRICGLEIPTADLIRTCALAAGFNVDEEFLHALANRSAMRLSRSSTGGEIPFERVFVFN